MIPALKSNYKNSIRMTIKRDQWVLETDRGQQYNLAMSTGSNTPWTDWMDKQTRGGYKKLRDWQKSIFQMWTMAFEPYANITLYTAFRKGYGYNQDHDIAVAYDNTNKTWLISTEEDFWIQQTEYREFDLQKSTSHGSLMDENTRKHFYQAIDQLRGETL